jgi:hypothetical protein
MSDRLPDHQGYPVTHCWYYHLGGRIPYPKEILAHVRECASRGYIYNDIQEAGQKPEPTGQDCWPSLRRKSGTIYGETSQPTVTAFAN